MKTYMPPKSQPKAKRGRPSGAPTKPIPIAFDQRQRSYLDAIRGASEFGKPSYTELVRAAVELLIHQALAKPDLRRSIEAYLGDDRKGALKVVRGGKK